ncbi:MAG: class I SAM-dependent methyltransferase [Chloroflexi bacterium]|nr:MAG: class I SAM-dependent methyltransferase [Chloroflexota bacterium]
MTQQSSRYDSTRRAWEQIWDSASVAIELEAVQYTRSIKTIERYLPYLPHDDVILEAGSGLSAVVITLRRMGYNVVGMDYAVNALYISREFDETLPLFAGDVHALPHADHSIGAYLSFGVLEHFEHGMQPALREAYRVLKPGGTLVLTIPYPNIVHRLVQWRRRGTQSTLTDDDFYESTYTKDALVENVTAVGFEIKIVVPTSHSFTWWGLGGPFRGKGYYETSALAEALGNLTRIVLPWAFNFTTLLVAQKTPTQRV